MFSELRLAGLKGRGSRMSHSIQIPAGKAGRRSTTAPMWTCAEFFAQVAHGISTRTEQAVRKIHGPTLSEATRETTPCHAADQEQWKIPLPVCQLRNHSSTTVCLHISLNMLKLYISSLVPNTYYVSSHRTNGWWVESPRIQQTSDVATYSLRIILYDTRQGLDWTLLYYYTVLYSTIRHFSARYCTIR